MRERSSQEVTSPPVRSWTDAESQIRRWHRDALGELTEQESRRLYALELAASRHAATSPLATVQGARRILS
jgi:hypothetical protein